MAALAYTHTGMIAAVPAATGLAALAASDVATHHFSLRTLRVSSVLVGIGLVVDSGRAEAWDQLLVAGVIHGPHRRRAPRCLAGDSWDRVR